MADGSSARPVESEKTPEVEEFDGFKFQSFKQDEQMNSIVTSQRKRVPKRSFANFGLTTLSVTNESAARIKKRNRKDDKRIVVDRVDGFTFISAFTLNDFDEYEKNPVKRPLAPTKRKAGTKNQPATSNKKMKQSDSSTPESLPAGVREEKLGNLTQKKSPVANEAGQKKKTVSPLTKSALVRLKKISVSGLKKNSPVNKQTKNVQDGSKGMNKNKTSCSKNKKSINLKVPLMKIGSSKKSKIPHMQIDKPMLNGDKTIITLSDDEDNLELDVCGVDENSSSQFILSNMNKPISASEEPKDGDPSKPKKKPCRVCCAYPCRIVGARKRPSSGSQFPSFDVSYTSRCQVHTPGEILINEPKQGKASISIQTTFTDIRMHLDFARRFPYRTISVVSCQPSLYDDDLKLPDNLATATNQRCSENHRILEQKRREELHGLYCKLADTLSISKNRASKQWILENAIKEIKSLEDKSAHLNYTLSLEESLNDKKKKRWEELAEKPYVAPKLTSKPKLMELYEKYRQERDSKEAQAKLQEEENAKKEWIKKIKKSQKGVKRKPYKKSFTPNPNDWAACKPHLVKSNNSSLKPNGAAQNPASTKNSSLGSMKSSTMAASHNGPEIKSTQPVSMGTATSTVKQTSLGQPIEHTTVSSRLASNPAIPKIDLTTESNPNQEENQISKSNPLSELSQLLARNPNLAPAAGTTATQATLKLLKSSSDPSSALSQTVISSFSSPNVKKLNLPSSVDFNMDCIIVTMVVNKKRMVFKIPKTAEGLTLLSKLSSLNMLSSDSFSKIVAQFPVNQLEQSANTIASLCTSLATPTQWSAVALSPSVSITERSQPANELIAPTAFETNTGSTGNAVQTIKLASIASQSLKPSSDSFATISRPIKEPVATTAVATTAVATTAVATTTVASTTVATTTVATGNDNVGTISQAKQPMQLDAVKVETSSNVGESEQVKPINAIKSSQVVNGSQEKSKDVSQQPKVVLYDLTKNNKAEGKPFTVIPAPSSINVTLNKLGSITANKVHNKRPEIVKSQVIPSSASTSPLPSATQTNPQKPFTKTSAPLTPPGNQQNTNITTAPLTSQTNPRSTHFTKTPTSKANKPKLSYQFHRATPVKILPKGMPVSNVFTTFQNVPICTSNIPILPSPPARILTNEPPDDLPEIPPDIPNDLTRASLSPLEKIPEISDSLFDDIGKKDVEKVDEPGFCVISNVFSLTETSQSATANNLEKKPDSTAVDSNIDKNVSVDSSLTVTTDEDIANQKSK